MGRIFYVMGKSSSGKDSIYTTVKNNKALGLKPIVLYTTRPIREGEVNGREYFFVDVLEYESKKLAGKIIESRTYNTVYGEWIYFTVLDEQIDLEQNNYIAIGTLESYQKIRKYFGSENILPLYIEVEDGIRLQRALERERKESMPKYTEMCRRFLADAEDFSEENIKAAEIDRVFNNMDLKICLDEIEEFIRENL
jgi:Guanylate kinase